MQLARMVSPEREWLHCLQLRMHRAAMVHGVLGMTSIPVFDGTDLPPAAEVNAGSHLHDWTSLPEVSEQGLWGDLV